MQLRFLHLGPLPSNSNLSAISHQSASPLPFGPCQGPQDKKR